MNTRNAFHGLDENLQALAMPSTTTTTTAALTASTASNSLKSEPSKKPSFSSRSKSLLEEDDYFKVNLPPTYDMQPQQPLTEDESTVLGLMNDKCSKGYENMVKDLSRAMQTSEEPTNLVTPYR